MRSASTFLVTVSLLIILARASRGEESTFAVLGMKPPVLTKPAQLDKHLGRLVVVRGVLSRTRVPRIIGVEVEDRPELRGQLATATGILVRPVAKVEQLSDAELRGTIVLDGPGIKYRLYRDLEGHLSKPFRLKEQSQHIPRIKWGNMWVDQHGILRESTGRAVGYWGIDANYTRTR